MRRSKKLIKKQRKLIKTITKLIKRKLIKRKLIKTITNIIFFIVYFNKRFLVLRLFRLCFLVPPLIPVTYAMAPGIKANDTTVTQPTAPQTCQFPFTYSTVASAPSLISPMATSFMPTRLLDQWSGDNRCMFASVPKDDLSFVAGVGVLPLGCGLILRACSFSSPFTDAR